jgi:hypothetical protein
MPGRILYALDFGKYQPLALPCLARLKDAGAGELVLLHVTSEERSLRQFPELLREDVARCLTEAVQQRMSEWAASDTSESL